MPPIHRKPAAKLTVDSPKEDKVAYVKKQGQTREHHCHWPNCNRPVPPAMWGCKQHWFTLPLILRNKIWAAYRPGQEVNLTPSKEYIAVAIEVEQWIINYLSK
jgi:hypothetical protein